MACLFLSMISSSFNKTIANSVEIHKKRGSDKNAHATRIKSLEYFSFFFCRMCGLYTKWFLCSMCWARIHVLAFAMNASIVYNIYKLMDCLSNKNPKIIHTIIPTRNVENHQPYRIPKINTRFRIIRRNAQERVNRKKVNRWVQLHLLLETWMKEIK